MPSTLSRFYERAAHYFRKSPALEIYTDGSSKKGIGSWAFVISQPGKGRIESSGHVRRASSNVMEFRAAIEAVSALPFKLKSYFILGFQNRDRRYEVGRRASCLPNPDRYFAATESET